jgi:hypothetical protein
MGPSQKPLRDLAREVWRTVNGVSFEFRSPMQWLRRRGELAALDPRRRELEAELSRYCGHSVQLVSVQAKRSYDEVYYALRDGQKFAVVRVNNPWKKQVGAIQPQSIAVPLQSRERLRREWTAYERLFPSGLSPQPIWRAEDAIACGWLNWPRASETILRDRDQFWPTIETVLPAIRQMHDCGITHLDLNLGNILTEPNTRRVAFIDFEFGAVPAVTVPQQRAFDYLRLIDECVRPRRGGKQMLGDLDRLVLRLQESVDEEARDADMSRVWGKLHRLASHAELRQKLRTVFPRL